MITIINRDTLLGPITAPSQDDPVGTAYQENHGDITVRTVNGWTIYWRDGRVSNHPNLDGFIYITPHRVNIIVDVMEVR